MDILSFNPMDINRVLLQITHTATGLKAQLLYVCDIWSNFREIR